MQVKIHLDLSRATGPAPFTVATLDGELRVLLVNLARLPFPCLLRDRRPGEPIKHLVVIFEENETFDHYFGTYPDALNPPGEPARRPLHSAPAALRRRRGLRLGVHLLRPLPLSGRHPDARAP
jgi:phospholipase C